MTLAKSKEQSRAQRHLFELANVKRPWHLDRERGKVPSGCELMAKEEVGTTLGRQADKAFQLWPLFLQQLMLLLLIKVTICKKRHKKQQHKYSWNAEDCCSGEMSVYPIALWRTCQSTLETAAIAEKSKKEYWEMPSRRKKSVLVCWLRLNWLRLHVEKRLKTLHQTSLASASATAEESNR